MSILPSERKENMPIKKDVRVFNRGDIVEVDVENRRDRPSRWVNATMLDWQFRDSFCLVEVDGECLGYPKELVRAKQ
jgi:hypothetical protein